MGYQIHEFRGSYLSFVGEKWQNLLFLGKTRVLVPVPMDRDQVVPVPVVSGTGTHLQNRVGTSINQSGIGTDASNSLKFWTLALLSPIFVHRLFRDPNK